MLRPDELLSPSIVANATMNRGRGLSGVNSYERDLRFSITEFLAGRVRERGEAFTRPYGGRTIANWVDFLSRIEDWLPAEAGRVYAILDNLSAHRAGDVLLFSLAHPRWEFVSHPVYAAYLNLIEPWWKTLRSLALKLAGLEARWL